MNSYHLKLNLPVRFDPVFPKNPTLISEYNIELINKELIEFLLNLKLCIYYSEVFYLSPSTQSKHDPHLDRTEFDNHAKINFVYSDTDALMNWYIVKEEFKNDIKECITTTGSHYLEIDEAKCDLVHSAYIGKPSLINVGQFHGVSTVESPRFCFSFVLGHLSDGALVNWDDALILFKDYYQP